MKLTKNHFLVIGALLGIIAVYFTLRLFNILALPMFTDEAIYVRWAQIAAQDASWRFISLTDGKQPSFIWIAMILVKLVSDPLLAGRLVSVFAGSVTVVGLFFLGNEIFKSKENKAKIFFFSKKTVTIGLLSSFIYVIYPFGLVYDRMALYDSLVGAFAVWSLYLLFLLVRSLRLDVALIAGLVIGGGLLTKTNAFFSLYSIPFLLLLLDFSKKKFKNQFIKFTVLVIVTAILSNLIYSILRLSPYFHIITEKNAIFVYPIGEWIKSPFKYFVDNVDSLVIWFVTYFSIPSVLLTILSFVIKKDNFKEKVVLVLWFAFPFAALTFFGNTIYPRFIMFMTLSLIPLIAYSLYYLFDKYKSAVAKGLIVLFAFAFYIYADFMILTNFSKAPIPKSDLEQYVNGWSAGHGLSESVEFLKKESEKGKIFVLTQGTFGLMPYGLEIYLVDNPNIEIFPLWPIENIPPKELIEASKTKPSYLIFYQACPHCKDDAVPPATWPVSLISEYRQGNSDFYYRIYKFGNQ